MFIYLFLCSHTSEDGGKSFWHGVPSDAEFDAFWKTDEGKMAREDSHAVFKGRISLADILDTQDQLEQNPGISASTATILAGPSKHSDAAELRILRQLWKDLDGQYLVTKILLSALEFGEKIRRKQS